MKLGRNDPCSCGSGKKFKNCCQLKGIPTRSRPSAPPDAELKRLGNLFNAGRFAEVENQAHLMVEQYPNCAPAWKLLGVSLHLQGKSSLPALRRSVELSPMDAMAHSNLGNVLKDLGNFEDAVASYRRALKLKPDLAGIHYNLGLALTDLKQFDESAASYRKVLALQPDHAEAHCNLGNVLCELGKYQQALESYRKALAIKPRYAEAHNNLGNALIELGQHEDAVESFRRALEIKPDFGVAYFNLGNVLRDLGQFEEAVVNYRKALKTNPDYAEAHNNLGVALQHLGQLEEAVECYRRALDLIPDYAYAHINLGHALREFGQLDDALESYRRALEIKKDFTGAFSSLVFTLNYSARFAHSYCLDEAQRYGRMVSALAGRQFTEWKCAATPERIKVGLVSGDLRNHPVGYFLESLLAHIDPSRIELIAYPTDIKTDALTARIKPFFSAWKPLTRLGDNDAANLIHDDGINVLIDLSGHTTNNRLPIFAWKPAPVQVSWMGYLATTGVTEIDYMIADPVGVPESQRKLFTETVWYMPDSLLCFSPPDTDLPVTDLPAQNDHHITFGCFQNLAKVSDDILATWSEILAALPGSRLRLQCKQLRDPLAVKGLIQRFQLHGIDPARVQLHGSVPREAYLATISEVDMILDTFPYAGCTTTCEAMWMGVPTLTLAGDTLLSRQGASLLTAAGLGDWIATSREDYIAKALAFASDLSELSALRSGLREKVRTSPLLDAPRFARNFEDALWSMWKLHLKQI
jgi:predicted O-linked N-acetylglucosamine transferase (SPINDLY family)